MRMPPEHIVPAHEHPAQKMLERLDPRFELRFNQKLKRYEVWGRDWTPIGIPIWTIVERVVADPKRGGYAEPGEWLLEKLRRRDLKRNPDLADIVKSYSEEIEAHNAALEAERERKHQDQIRALADETARPLRRFVADALMDDHPTSDVPFPVPDTYPKGKD